MVQAQVTRDLFTSWANVTHAHAASLLITSPFLRSEPPKMHLRVLVLTGGSPNTKAGAPKREPPPYFSNSQPSASSAFCSSGVSLAIPMPVAAQSRAKKMAIQFEIAHGM